MPKQMKAETKADFEAKIKDLRDIIELKDQKIEALKERVDVLSDKSKALENKYNEQKKVLEPESGDGPRCQVYKLTMSQASRDDAGQFQRDSEGNFVSICKNHYTQEYDYLGKPTPGGEAQKKKAYLCKEHAKIYLGVGEE